jgi:hypothetical protein
MAARSYLKEKEHERELIAAWLQRPEATRTENDILKFYSELAEAHSPLLDFECSGDKYQALKLILRHHIKREQCR